MNSRVYAKADALSELGCARVRQRPRARVLIGGLGMGYALATALAGLERDAEVVVAELVPSVVAWNRSLFGPLAGYPLNDPRVTIREADVGLVLKEGRGAFDAVLLDVDNGPEGLTRQANDQLYTPAGLASARAALRPDGVLGIWSAGPRQGFARKVQAAGFEVEEIPITARGGGRGARHVLWLARRGPALLKEKR